MFRSIFSICTLVLLSACSKEPERPLATRTANPEPVVYGIFAPGQGENILDDGAINAKSFTSQREKYAALPNAVDNFDAKDIETYFRKLSFDPIPSDEIRSEIKLREDVRIVRDKTHNIPRVYGDTRAAAMFGVGYARAQDRLWQMEVMRYRADASLATLLGPGEENKNLKSDAKIFTLIDYSQEEWEEMWDQIGIDYGDAGKTAQSDLENYIQGINAYIAATRSDENLLPIEFRRRDLTPADWSVYDELKIAAYSMTAAFSPFSVANAGRGPTRLYRQLTDRFGIEEGEKVYADLRSVADPQTPYYAPPSNIPPRGARPLDGNALPDLDSFVARSALQIGDVKIGSDGKVPPTPTKSNAFLIAPYATTTGFSLASQGPQDPPATPHPVDHEIQIIAPDFIAHGVLEFVGPYPYNGARSRDYAFSLTVQPNDLVDIFVEQLCEPNGEAPTLESNHYTYQGECRKFTTRTETRDLPTGRTFTLHSMRSVHGPVLGYATVDGAPVALVQARSSYKREGMNYPAYSQLFSPSKITSANDLIKTVAGKVGLYAAFYYVSADEIAAVDPAITPVRAESVNNDFPIWGTGEWDWADFNPDTYEYRPYPPEDHPHVINPESGIIVGWNAQSSLNWPSTAFVWSNGPAHRTRLLRDPAKKMLEQRKLSLEDVIRIYTHAAVTDRPSLLLYPTIRRIIGIAQDDEIENLLTRVDAWVQDGALRRDMDNDGFYEHAAAIALMDATWRHLYPDVFLPVLGQEIMNDVKKRESVLGGLDGFRSDWFLHTKWVQYLYKDLETQFGSGQQQPMSRPYCGEGDKGKCAFMIENALKKGLTEVKSKLGPDPDKWRYAAVGDEAVVKQNYPSTGAATPAKPTLWQDRSTYHLVTTFEEPDSQ
ncbi:MAG: penicillin acylase family protein [Pseudomonadota bacterium]